MGQTKLDFGLECELRMKKKCGGLLRAFSPDFGAIFPHSIANFQMPLAAATLTCNYTTNPIKRPPDFGQQTTNEKQFLPPVPFSPHELLVFTFVPPSGSAALIKSAGTFTGHQQEGIVQLVALLLHNLGIQCTQPFLCVQQFVD